MSAYSNPKSIAFLKIAREIEGILLTQLKKNNSDVQSVQVIKITNGSIIVDFNVISNSFSKNASVIQMSIMNAIKSGGLDTLNANKASNVTAKGLLLYIVIRYIINLKKQLSKGT